MTRLTSDELFYILKIRKQETELIGSVEATDLANQYRAETSGFSREDVPECMRVTPLNVDYAMRQLGLKRAVLDGELAYVCDHRFLDSSTGYEVPDSIEDTTDSDYPNEEGPNPEFPIMLSTIRKLRQLGFSAFQERRCWNLLLCLGSPVQYVVRVGKYKPVASWESEPATETQIRHLITLAGPQWDFFRRGEVCFFFRNQSYGLI